MRTLLVAVVGVLVACISARPSALHWKVPCWGTIVPRELVCGANAFPPPQDSSRSSNTSSLGRVGQQTRQGNPHNPKHPQQGRPRSSSEEDSAPRLPSLPNSSKPGHGGGFNPYSQNYLAVPGLYVHYEDDRTLCRVDGYISSASLVYRYSEESCDGLYEVHNSYLVVYPPCSGHFLLAMCQTEW